MDPRPSSQLPRRSMLTTSLLLSLGVSSRRLPAAVRNLSSRFIIVSDTHLGRGNSDAPEKQWRQAIAEINLLPAGFVLHLGDIVDSARPEQYPMYLAARQLLDKPIHEIPGNHDDPQLFRQHIAPQTDRVIDRDQIRFVLFNNTRRDSHDGFISAEQLKWLREQMRDAARSNLALILCCHVPIHSNSHPDRGWYVKPTDGQTEFYELLAEHADRVIACLHGHFHNGIRGWNDHGPVESLVPSVCYNQNRNLATHLADGSAAGFFLNELRPGYVIADIADGSVNLQYKPLGQNAIPAAIPH